jgi:hypothetical protein
VHGPALFSVCLEPRHDLANFLVPFCVGLFGSIVAESRPGLLLSYRIRKPDVSYFLFSSNGGSSLASTRCSVK